MTIFTWGASRPPQGPQRRPSSLLAALVATWLACPMGALAQAPARPAVGSAPSAPTTQKALAEYDVLFGAEERRVAATPSTKDDAKFASDLIAKSRNVKDEPDLMHIMYEKAYAYGAKDPDGFAAAIDAARELSKGADAEWRPKLMDLYRKAVRLGTGNVRAAAGEALISGLIDDSDALEGSQSYSEATKRCREALSVASTTGSVRWAELDLDLKNVQARQQAAEKLARLAPHLAADPENVALRRQLVDISIFDLDDPRGAARYSSADMDADTRAIVKLAAKDAAARTPAELLALARSYQKVSGRLASGSRGAALGASELCATRFLKAHHADDAERLEALELLRADLTSQAATGEGVLADRVAVWNTHNSVSNARGATSINIILVHHGRPVWRRDNCSIPWRPGEDTSIDITVPRVIFDKVRVEVTAWTGMGGGLAEIQVFIDTVNLALGGQAAVSASYDFNYPASALTDGITTSAEYKGFWVLPNKQPGWAEITVPGDVDAVLGLAKKL